MSNARTRDDLQLFWLDRLIAWLIEEAEASAEHDPAQFPDPDRFGITRDANPHIGAPPARLEIRYPSTR